jgi:hypothetical protein
LKKFCFILFILAGISFGTFAQNGLGVDQVLNSNRFMKFYPNPATSAISFDFQRNYESNYSILIFNFMGKKVYEVKNTAPRININLDDFYRGIYVFQLRDKNGLILETGKFQVVK